MIMSYDSSLEGAIKLKNLHHSAYIIIIHGTGLHTHTGLLSRMVKTSSLQQETARCREVLPSLSCASGLAWYSSSRLAIPAMLSLGHGASRTDTDDTVASACNSSSSWHYFSLSLVILYVGISYIDWRVFA